MTALPIVAQHLLRLMHGNLDFVELLDANGMVQGVSASIKPLSGYDPRELIGRHYQDIVHPEDRDRAEQSFVRAVRGARPETVKIRYRAAGGLWRTILVSMQSFLNDADFHAVMVATRDVTAQCDLEELLLVANVQVASLRTKLIGAAETERKYIAAELHDDVQQILFGLRLNMTPLRGSPVDELPTELVGGWVQTVQMAMDHLHELTLLLQKPLIDNQSLPGAMRSYVDSLPLAPNQKVLFEADARVGTPAPNVAHACFRIVQEALGNAIKHSGATTLLVRLSSSVDRLTVSIRDDGVGFDVRDAGAHAVDAGSVGLASMRERATLAGGRFNIQSSIGHGTSIRASFPIVARSAGSERHP